MNLYDLHSKPETLKGYHQRFKVPELAYQEAINRVSSSYLGVSVVTNRGERFPDLEPAIAKSAEWAVKYAYTVIGGRFPEGEAAIAIVPHWAFQYALNVIRGRFPEGEPVIAKSPEWAVKYARHVLKKRWRKAEPVIATDLDVWGRRYEDEFNVTFLNGKVIK